MEVTELAPPLAAIADALPSARYVFFGFGDRHYLLARKHNAPILLASLWPGAGMLLLTGLSSTPEAGFGANQVISLTLDAHQMRALQEFVWNTLEIRGRASSPYAPGPYPDSVYFAASTKYSALRTCNTWVAEALHASGLPIHPTGLIFAGQVWSRVQGLQRTQRAARREPSGQQP